ncbi:UxaA family hydrolase [Desulfotomaculum nigrificans]|uniref:UxaA family hydrolase n=1 Tax=Desulfotomaculum nigrificans TaxID=1565 RepID=UPI0001FAEC91|nr:altronate dehydratase family protein [Desulfotomaculum nigrificans]
MEKEFGLLQIHSNDNVAVAMRNLLAGERILVAGKTLQILEDIPTGHKVALVDITPGTQVIKYGYSIGKATNFIPAGSWVHTNNLTTGLDGLVEYHYNPQSVNVVENQNKEMFFDGYLRENGQAGIRNEIWIINTVGCCNKVAEELSRRAMERFKGRKIDGVFQFSHPYGCSQLGQDHRNTQKILAGLVQHPNAGGVLVLGLGCENNHIEEFKRVLGPYDPDRVKFLNTQDVEDELSEGLLLLEKLVDHAERYERVRVPVAKLIIGLKCGGSDAFSGITANPLVGEISDRLISAGGSSLLTEVPEMFGAETILMNRAADEAVFQKTVQLINDFKQYFLNHNQVIYENPSPGNKKGGITTLEEKSLGCTQKGGRGKVVDVLNYGERVSVPGLNLLSGPGNDMVAVTALAAAGAQLILFTTGRGTPLGGPVPTVKISSNSDLARRKANWIDFNAGQLLEGKAMSELSDEFWNYILSVASGKLHTKNEENNYREIAIFKDGVTL